MGETNSEPENPSTAETASGESEGKVATTGENVLTLLRQATDLAGGNSRYAVDIAPRMSDQLWAVQKSVADLQARVTELETEVQMYREKSERAELWLGKISSEIQERVLGSQN
jgi:uncharacterized protein YlxW (UPF0749 family)